MLGANRITDLGLSEIVRAINHDLLVLDLSQNKITKVDNRLLQIISDVDYKLQEINFANNLLKVHSVQFICRSVA